MEKPVNIPERGRWPLSARVAVWICVAGWIGAAMAIVAAANQIRTIVFSGPMLLILAVPALLLALTARHARAIVLALFQLLYPVFIFLMIFLLELPPERAHLPVVILSLIYLGVSGLVLIWVGRGRARHRSDWECATCGYLLVGLTSPRCPECGRPFDQELVAKALRTREASAPFSNDAPS